MSAHAANTNIEIICTPIRMYCVRAETSMPTATMTPMPTSQSTPKNVTQKLDEARLWRLRNWSMYSEAICTRLAMTIIDAAMAAKPTAQPTCGPKARTDQMNDWPQSGSALFIPVSYTH